MALTILSSCIAWLALGAAAELDEFAELANLGKAHLENRDSAKALEALSAAIRLNALSAPIHRNLARAHLLAGNAAAALEDLNRANEIAPEPASDPEPASRPAGATTFYLLGVAYARMSKFTEAAPQFEKAAQLDPHTAAIRFQLAGAYAALGRTADVRTQLKETVRLDPLHASAHYKLATFARESGDQAEFQSRLREFTRLRKLFSDDTRTPEALELCIHTWPEGLPPVARTGQPAGKSDETPLKVRFQEATDGFTNPADAAGEPPVGGAVAATVIELAEDGRYTLITVGEEGEVSLLRMGPQQKFQRTMLSAKLPAHPSITCCIAGGFYNDTPQEAKPDATRQVRTDVFLIGPRGAWLLKQTGQPERTGPEQFEDVTQAAGLEGLTGRRACWVDYEHDGDLDLLIARESGTELWQNNGDGRFTNVTAQVGIEGTGPAFDVAAADLDANVAVDVVIGRDSSPTLVYENQRAGRFARSPEPPGPWPSAKRVLLDDLDHDGFADAVLLADRRAECVLHRGGARPRLDFDGMEGTAGTLIDFDNDGSLDVCVGGRKAGDAEAGSIQLWRNHGAADFKDVSGETGLSALALPPIRDIIAADLDHDADTDLLLLTTDGRLRFLRNEGGNARAQIKVRLTGTKTNPLGIGTHVEARRGHFWIARSIQAIPIEIGLGQRNKLDSLQTVWTNGVVDNQTEVAVSARPITIVEKNVATGSCPFLYVWDGTRFRFVTDLLGNSPVGLSLRRDVLLPADPDEIVWVGPADQVVPRDGKYVFQVTSEFREVLYFDSVRLLAVDHPPNVEPHSTDKLVPPPFPPSEVWTLHEPSPLLHATGSDGIDRTAALRTLDGVFAPPGAPLSPPYRGMGHPLAVTLDFGPLPLDRPLVLALTGWLQYGDASTNIALSQDSSLTVIPPRLEAETDPDRWMPVDVVVGMPAGKTKTILCDLAGKLPKGTRRLRLTTTFEIRWDRVALLQRLAPPQPVVHELQPRIAELHWRGFSEIKSRAQGHPTTPDHNLVFNRPPWRTALQGWCTRYGDVLELVTRRDERLVLINSGDALTLEFDASDLPAPAAGFTRTFMFYSVGWDKDGDYNVVEGDTVEPLPITTPTESTDGEPDAADWRLHYNTRWVPRDAFSQPDP